MYRTAENLSVLDYGEVPASGVFMRTPKETGSEKVGKWLWRTSFVPAGLLSLGAFIAVEADRPEVAEAASISSWGTPQERTSLAGSQSQSALSLQQAASLAIEVFEKAEEEIRAEREAEARLLASLWQNEDL